MANPDAASAPDATLDPHVAFCQEVEQRISQNDDNVALREASQRWIELADAAKYEYNFCWLGRPVIQYPQDLLALQEIIWRTQPDVIVETGIAHGGTTIFFASMLALLGGRRQVISIDIDIRAHNRAAIEAHPLFSAERIVLLQGSSIDPAIIAQVNRRIADRSSVLVCLDSNHAHAHVLAELRLYSPLVRKGGYLIVFDTSIQSIPGNGYPGKGWGKDNNPRTAVAQFLAENHRFAVDSRIESQLLITSAPGGFLRCVEDL